MSLTFWDCVVIFYINWVLLWALKYDLKNLLRRERKIG